MKKINPRQGKMIICPQGGDNGCCEDCVYYPDYKWSEEKKDCVVNKDNK